MMTAKVMMSFTDVLVHSIGRFQMTAKDIPFNAL